MMARKRWKGVELESSEPKQPNFSYRRADGSINLHLFKAEYLNTPEECAIAMGELDKLRGEFEGKIRQMRTNVYNGGEHAPPDVYHATMHLWSMAKIARNKVQDRRGQLRRQINLVQADEHNAARERGFVNAAKKLLSKEQYLAIWNLVEEEQTTRESDVA